MLTSVSLQLIGKDPALWDLSSYIRRRWSQLNYYCHHRRSSHHQQNNNSYFHHARHPIRCYSHQQFSCTSSSPQSPADLSVSKLQLISILASIPRQSQQGQQDSDTLSSTTPDPEAGSGIPLPKAVADDLNQQIDEIDDSVLEINDVNYDSSVEEEIISESSAFSSSSSAAQFVLPRTTKGRLRYDPSSSLLSNLCQPHLLYPLARSLNRRIIVHVGPTNSGKTHSALNALIAAESGVYGGPLRLLAWENYDKLTKQGLCVNLITGQEVIRPLNATHTSSTIEMLNTDSVVEVGVIDEMQMIDTDDRGGSWTKAFLSLPAKELHICGDRSIIHIVQSLCNITNETLTIQQYKRLIPLKLCPPLQSWSALRKGDCVIAFSRSALYELKHEIESCTVFKCCIIYGTLPPELRRQQAELFNNTAEDSEYSILLATDAIGMGLNLSIRRVIFTSIEKFDGAQTRMLTNREALQIAGRAGRFNSLYPEGYTTTLDKQDYPYLKQLLNTPLTPIQQAGLLPSFAQIQQFSRFKAHESLESLLSYLELYAEVDSLYFLCRLTDMIAIAKLLLYYESLSLEERFLLCLAPVDLEKPAQREALTKYIQQFHQQRKVTIDTLAAYQLSNRRFISDNGDNENSDESSMNEDSMNESNVSIVENPMIWSGLDLSELEDYYHQLDLYMWLSRRLGEDIFIQHQIAESLRNRISQLIATRLAKMGNHKTKKRNLLKRNYAQQQRKYQ